LANSNKIIQNVLSDSRNKEIYRYLVGDKGSERIYEIERAKRLATSWTSTESIISSIIACHPERHYYADYANVRWFNHSTARYNHDYMCTFDASDSPVAWLPSASSTPVSGGGLIDKALFIFYHDGQYDFIDQTSSSTSPAQTKHGTISDYDSRWKRSLNSPSCPDLTQYSASPNSAFRKQIKLGPLSSLTYIDNYLYLFYFNHTYKIQYPDVSSTYPSNLKPVNDKFETTIDVALYNNRHHRGPVRAITSFRHEGTTKLIYTAVYKNRTFHALCVLPCSQTIYNETSPPDTGASIIPDDYVDWSTCQRIVTFIGFVYTLHKYDEIVFSHPNPYMFITEPPIPASAIFADGNFFYFFSLSNTMYVAEADDSDCTQLKFKSAVHEFRATQFLGQSKPPFHYEQRFYYNYTTSKKNSTTRIIRPAGWTIDFDYMTPFDRPPSVYDRKTLLILVLTIVIVIIILVSILALVACFNVWRRKTPSAKVLFVSRMSSVRSSKLHSKAATDQQQQQAKSGGGKKSKSRNKRDKSSRSSSLKPRKKWKRKSSSKSEPI
ncbi:hypothetical protein GZH46_01207, partial [Fragariocoptes setiger]